MRFCVLILALLPTIIFYSCKNKSISGLEDKVRSNNEENHESLLNTQKKVSISEFVKWCGDEKNGLVIKKEVSELEFHLSYMPAYTMAYLELRNDTFDLNKLNKVAEFYTEMIYFNFRIKLKDKSGELLKYRLQSPEQYDERVRYISFAMQNDFYIVQKKDTIRPGLYQFERIYEVAPMATLMMAFDKKKLNINEEITLVYNDKLFNKGYVKFLIDKKQLIDIPNIEGL